MLHSVFFALMVGSPTHPPLLAQALFPPTHHTGQCPAPTHPPPPPPGSRNAPCACPTVQTARPHLPCIHCLLEAACLAAHALPPGRGMDLNPELLSASDMQCVGLVVQCMSQCRVHNLNFNVLVSKWLGEIRDLLLWNPLMALTPSIQNFFNYQGIRRYSHEGTFPPKHINWIPWWDGD